MQPEYICIEELIKKLHRKNNNWSRKIAIVLCRERGGCTVQGLADKNTRLGHYRESFTELK